DDVHIGEHKRVFSGLGLPDRLVEGQQEYGRILSRQYFCTKVGNLLVCRVLQVELGKTVARREIVTDNAWPFRRIRTAARPSDQFKKLYSTNISPRFGIQYSRENTLRVRCILKGSGINNVVLLVCRINFI